ncbi:TrkA family potassium uptake protein [Corynebacterium sp. CCM 9204]|uniref:potassium channel family protein n=1 Tax=Corynebacterium sp. CCM 9204 TaxID=3057616 RepID=UPI003523498F
MVSFLRRRSLPPVVILGLGRFGMALGEELVASGVEVLGVDDREDVVSGAAGVLTHATIANTTNIEALRQLSVHECQRVVVGIGSDMAASLLTASAVIELGVPNVWAKADGDAHAKILTQIGVHHVIRPERDTGRRIAHLMTGNVEEYAEFDRDFAVVKLAPPMSMLGKKVGDVPPGVHIVAVRHPGTRFAVARPDVMIRSGDLVIAAGDPDVLEAFVAAG